VVNGDAGEGACRAGGRHGDPVDVQPEGAGTRPRAPSARSAQAELIDRTRRNPSTFTAARCCLSLMYSGEPSPGSGLPIHAMARNPLPALADQWTNVIPAYIHPAI
jgi:hypothetical protein